MINSASSPEPCSDDPVKVQAFQRFVGWVFVLTGLGFTIAWLLLPLDVANPVAMTCLVAGMIITVSATLRLKRASRLRTN